ncbi:MAG: hypothetical protein KKB62_02565 [Nanoarchaeota archaeon]|nr:hypothetical protein [Nanoarchaeota archaeon]
MEFYFILSSITVLFFILLGIKELFNKKQKEKFCVVCASVTITWIALLVLSFLNLFNDKILIGILMGHTSLGLFYIFESKVREELKIFRLPILLSFISAIYFILEGFDQISSFILAGLWILFGLVYLFRNSKSKSFVNKLIACCRNW